MKTLNRKQLLDKTEAVYQERLNDIKESHLLKILEVDLIRRLKNDKDSLIKSIKSKVK